jgi:cell division protein FtsB
MPYTNSEQIFMDVLGGRSPSPDEQKQIDALLAILKRAGFVVDEPSNAAHVTLLAWGWARETGRGDILNILQGFNLQIDNKIAQIGQSIEQLKTITESMPVQNPDIDTTGIATAIAAAMPQPRASIKMDMSVFREAIMGSVSKLWLIVAGFGLAIFFFAGMKWAEHQIQPLVAQLRQQVQQVQAQNKQLIDKLAGWHKPK